jgi:hypothetical protein
MAAIETGSVTDGKAKDLSWVNYQGIPHFSVL